MGDLRALAAGKLQPAPARSKVFSSLVFTSLSSHHFVQKAISLVSRLSAFSVSVSVSETV